MDDKVMNVQSVGGFLHIQYFYDKIHEKSLNNSNGNIHKYVYKRYIFYIFEKNSLFHIRR
jgi:hypothetical protein